MYMYVYAYVYVYVYVHVHVHVVYVVWMDKKGVIWKQGTSQLFKTGDVLLYFDNTADWPLIDKSSNQHKITDNGFHND